MHTCLGCTCIAEWGLLIVGNHANVVDTLVCKFLHFLNKSRDVAGAADGCECSWHSHKDNLQPIPIVYKGPSREASDINVSPAAHCLGKTTAAWNKPVM